MSEASGFLPYARQSIDDDDVAAVAAALRSPFLTTGPLVEAFETDLARATGAVHAIVCNSGTAALHLATLALDIGPGDAVIVPAITFVATANVIRLAGAEVVFCDVDPNTGLMTPETLIEAERRAVKLGLKVKAVYPVHLNGQVCDMARLRAAVPTADVKFVEDACHALGSAQVGATANSDIACFSTHAVKAIATGEGGFVTTSNGALASRMRHIRSHGITRNEAEFTARDIAFENGELNRWYYEMQDVGLNYRMPDILCALGISQLKKLGGFLQRRREIAALYDELLMPYRPLLSPVPRDHSADGWHLYVLLIDFVKLGCSRQSVMARLLKENIGTQVHYIPVPWQPYYQERYGKLDLPGTANYYRRCLSIPFYPDMTDGSVRHVAAALATIIKT